MCTTAAISPIAESPEQSNVPTSTPGSLPAPSPAAQQQAVLPHEGTEEQAAGTSEWKACEEAQRSAQAGAEEVAAQLGAALSLTEEPDQALAAEPELTPLQQLLRLCDQQVRPSKLQD